jgi:quinol monooxygenase YgiN
MVMRFAGGGVGQEHYDAVMRELGLPLGDAGGTWPAALISHAAGSAPDGSWVVVDVWQSQEAFDQFLASDLGPAFARAGDLPQPDLTPFEVYNTYRHGS